ncbi:XdhC family protein, partial [Trichothermofontia sp.]
MNELQHILTAFEQSQQLGERTVLGTIVQTQGSVYRRPGARLLVTATGERVGTISGGCLEADLVERSRSLLTHGGAPILVRYDTTASDDLVFGLGLGCNGVVDVLLEAVDPAARGNPLPLIRTCLETQAPGVIATVFAVDNVPDVHVGDRVLLPPDRLPITAIANPIVAQRLVTDLTQTLNEQQIRIQTYPLAGGSMTVLLEIIRPPTPLLIFGAGDDAIPVVPLAKQVGWQVTVLDHRPALLSRDRFPLADHWLTYTPTQPQTYRARLTSSTVAVVMTHHYPSDLALLKTLLQTPLRYLGVLGPKRRMQQLEHDLATQGITLTPEQRQRLYSPIGLDIGAETPAEIALAIVAEIQAVMAGRTGQSLRDRPGAIHAPIPTS